MLPVSSTMTTANMRDNWLIREAKKTDPTANVVFLENPDKKNYLDRLLISKFWPVIRKALRNTHYDYSPKNNPKTDFELSYELARSLTFMLLEAGSVIFRGKLSCSVTGWMLESDFFLGLSSRTHPLVLFEILGNSRFRGLPPSLEIHKDRRDSYFQITFHSGRGTSWTGFSEQQIADRIREVIDVNAKLYEFSRDGYVSDEEIGEFLSLAYHVYEAY